MEERVPYRKLPGRRRGFLRGASVWLGPDHLLLVRSMRFREEYRRYQFRDIQAIVVAQAPRFHISTRAFAIAILWLIAYLAAGRWPGAWEARAVLWIAAAGLVVAWLLVSSLFSRRCRIYTAVSRDDLPSLYRSWTARQFLDIVEPLIREAQGALEGEWAKQIESRDIGPAHAPVAVSEARSQARTCDFTSDILVATLFADVLLNAFTIHWSERWVQTTNGVITLLEAAAAIAVIVQHYRGLLRPAMKRLAIATLVVMGVFYYARPLIVAFVVGARAAASKQPMTAALPVDPQMRTVDLVAAGVLGLVGLAIALFGGAEEEPRVISPSP